MRASEQGINPDSGQYEDIGRSMAWLPQTLALYVIPHTQTDSLVLACFSLLETL